MNWPTNSAPYGYGGRTAETIVLPVRITMFPTSSSRDLAGKNVFSAVARTIYGILPVALRRRHGGLRA